MKKFCGLGFSHTAHRWSLPTAEHVDKFVCEGLEEKEEVLVDAG